MTDPAWRVIEPTLEEIVIAYLRAQESTITTPGPTGDGRLGGDAR